MTYKKNWIRLAAAPVFVLGIGLVGSVGCSDVADIVEGCDEFSADRGWGSDLDIDLQVKTFMSASGSLVTVADQMLADVFSACEGIATATNRDAAKWSSLEGVDQVKAVCAEAQLGIDAVLQANTMIGVEVLIEGGGCQASLEAAAACNAKCDVTGQCTPAQLEAKCEPGQLAGQCSATCSGTCTADVGATVQCDGRCSATCNGTCDGATTNGRCDGVCKGDCSGSCELQTNATVQCSGTCKGDCSVAFTAPHCEGKLTPPECNLDADCEASCRAEVQAEATCTPPKVTINLVGGSTADLEKLALALEEHLPRLLTNVGARGQAAIDSGTLLVKVGGDLEGSLTSSGKAFVCATTAATAAFDASIKVQVSVQASVDVGGSAAATAM